MSLLWARAPHWPIGCETSSWLGLRAQWGPAGGTPGRLPGRGEAGCLSDWLADWPLSRLFLKPRPQPRGSAPTLPEGKQCGRFPRCRSPSTAFLPPPPPPPTFEPPRLLTSSTCGRSWGGRPGCGGWCPSSSAPLLPSPTGTTATGMRPGLAAALRYWRRRRARARERASGPGLREFREVGVCLPLAQSWEPEDTWHHRAGTARARGAAPRVCPPGARGHMVRRTGTARVRGAAPHVCPLCFSLPLSLFPPHPHSPLFFFPLLNLDPHPSTWGPGVFRSRTELQSLPLELRIGASRKLLLVGPSVALGWSRGVGTGNQAKSLCKEE